MSELNFLDARFEIRLTEAKSYSAQGKDDAEFYLSVNPGEPVRPLGDVASGGELSRIMLAIKTVLADEEFRYDEHFWEDFNIIPLEEELSKIIEKVALKIEKTGAEEE